MTWEDNKKWADRFIPEIKQILGAHLIGQASVEEDRLHATDLIMLNMKPHRIACRIRRSEYLAKYGGEFTIRSKVESGNSTELAKIVEGGWADYLFYGFADEPELKLDSWFLGDLNLFRLWFVRQCVSTFRAPGETRTNADGLSSFRIFKISDLPEGFVVYRKEKTNE